MSVDYNSEIESLALNEDKIVSYKLINQKFDITPLEAKKALLDFVTKSRTDKVQKLNFFVTYSVIGENLKTKKKHVLLVNEQDFDGISNDYKVLSKQIYSIQKNFIEDFDLIYGNDLAVSNDINRKSNISTAEVGARDAAHSSGFTTSASVDSLSASTNAIKISKSAEITAKASTIEATVTNKSEVKHEPKEASEPPVAKKSASSGGIAAMFSKQQAKKPVVVVKKKEEEANEVMEIIEEKEKAVPAKKTTKSPEAKKKEQKVKSKKVLKSIKKEFDSDVEMEMDPEEAKKEEKNAAMKKDLFDDEHDAEMMPAPSAEQPATTTGEEDDYEDEQINKKRRRKGAAAKKKPNSQVINSDDEDTNDSVDGESKKKQASKKPKIKKPDNNIEIDQMLNKENRNDDHSNHKKKLVTKTFVDQDGYKVTQKVWETVEDDDTTPAKSEATAAAAAPSKEEKNKKPDAKTAKVVLNQPTLTNFFKRS